VRAFADENVPHPYETVDPQRDVEVLDGEFLLTDLMAVESRIESSTPSFGAKGRTAEKAVTDELRSCAG
ncbi:MAG: redox-regulated ATPase YchF, partial [Chloroflexi bacterium]|nr:redox-regulated ATPase YchF [Chloroflexota bacterium]